MSPPLSQTLVAACTLGLFLLCFYQFSGKTWPGWKLSLSSDYTIVTNTPSASVATGSAISEIAFAENIEVASPGEKTRWVIIDPGHGGVDGGTQGHGILEKNYALDISKRLRIRLKEFGIPVLMTREDDSVVKLSRRSELANKRNCAAFVSIHLNYSAVPAVSGVETFYSDPKGSGSTKATRSFVGIDESTKFQDERSKLLADAIQGRVCASTGANNRGTKNRRLLVTLNTHAPAALVECGFLSHAGESTRLKKESYRQEIAEAIAGGIIKFLEKTSDDPYHGIAFESPADDPRLPAASQATSPPLAQVPSTE